MAARGFVLTLTALDNSSDGLPPLFDGTRVVRATASTVRQLCRAVEAELHCGCSVVLMNDGHALSHASGGLDPLSSSCELAVMPSQKRRHHLHTPRAISDEQQLGDLGFPPFLGQGTSAAGSAAVGAGYSVTPKRRSVDFLLVGESVKRNRHLARFASAPYLPALLVDPAMAGLWRRKGPSLRKELIEAYVVVEALEQRVLQQQSQQVMAAEEGEEEEEHQRVSGTNKRTAYQAEAGSHSPHAKSSVGQAEFRRSARGVVVDLCAGKGFLSVIVGYEFPNAVVPPLMNPICIYHIHILHDAVDLAATATCVAILLSLLLH